MEMLDSDGVGCGVRVHGVGAEGDASPPPLIFIIHSIAATPSQ